MAKILIVDDEHEFRSMLRTKLEHHGHQVCEAPDGRTGIGLHPVGAFDIVLTDIDLPDISGFEVIRQLKKASTHANIIVVTADRKIEFVKDVAEQLGARFTFKKPLDVSKLVSMIQQVTDPKSHAKGERLHAHFGMKSSFTTTMCFSSRRSPHLLRRAYMKEQWSSLSRRNTIEKHCMT